MPQNKRESNTIYWEYEPENDRYVLKDDGVVIAEVPDDGSEKLTINTLDSKNGYTDETSNRSLDTWYQNNTGSDMVLSANVFVSADNTIVALRWNVDSDESGNQVANHTIRSAVTNAIISAPTVVVPNGYYYRLNVGGDTGDFSLNSWQEQV